MGVEPWNAFLASHAVGDAAQSKQASKPEPLEPLRLRRSIAWQDAFQFMKWPFPSPGSRRRNKSRNEGIAARAARSALATGLFFLDEQSISPTRWNVMRIVYYVKSHHPSGRRVMWRERRGYWGLDLMMNMTLIGIQSTYSTISVQEVLVRLGSEKVITACIR